MKDYYILLVYQRKTVKTHFFDTPTEYNIASSSMCLVYKQTSKQANKQTNKQKCPDAWRGGEQRNLCAAGLASLFQWVKAHI